MKITIFWDVTLCRALKAHGSFGGTYCLPLQGRRENQQEVGAKLFRNASIEYGRQIAYLQ
jgi:hypothetical protein